MYVCSCNALTDVEMRRVINQYGVDRPAAVFAACRCRAQCGTCVRSVCALISVCLPQASAAHPRNMGLMADLQEAQ